MTPLIAPTFPPAAAFEQPAVTPRRLSVRNYSVAELMQRPDAWTIVVKHLPAIRMMTGNEQAKPALANMTVVDFASLMGVNNATYDAIDAELASLPNAGGVAQ